jgi:hypothetical protein
MNGWESKEEKWPNPYRLIGVFGAANLISN